MSEFITPATVAATHALLDDVADDDHAGVEVVGDLAEGIGRSVVADRVAHRRRLQADGERGDELLRLRHGVHVPALTPDVEVLGPAIDAHHEVEGGVRFRCQLGGGFCGAGDPCPMHEKLVAVQQAVEHVQSIKNNLQSMSEPALDRIAPELQPLGQQLDQVEHARPAVEADDVHVDAHRALERRRREQV